jgi:hypothetical protein
LSTTQNACGDVQRLKSAPSSEHSNVEPGWSAENTKIAFSLLLGGVNEAPSITRPDGPEVIVVAGAGTTVIVRVAGVVSWLPARSTERIRIVCSPGSRPWKDSGDVHCSNGALSTEHSNVIIRSGVALSEPMNSKSAGVSGLIRAGGAVTIPVVGGVVSAVIVHVYRAGVGSMLPSKFGLFGSTISGSAASIARTSNVCSPGAICGSS